MTEIDGIEASIEALNHRMVYILKTAHWSNALVNELTGLQKAIDILFDLREEARERATK